jgi:hypothetical protein
MLTRLRGSPTEDSSVDFHRRHCVLTDIHADLAIGISSRREEHPGAVETPLATL